MPVVSCMHRAPCGCRQLQLQTPSHGTRKHVPAAFAGTSLNSRWAAVPLEIESANILKIHFVYRRNSCSCELWRPVPATHMCTWHGARCASNTATALAVHVKSLPVASRPAPSKPDFSIALSMSLFHLPQSRQQEVAIGIKDVHVLQLGLARHMLGPVQECTAAAGVGGDGGGGWAP